MVDGGDLLPELDAEIYDVDSEVMTSESGKK